MENHSNKEEKNEDAKLVKLALQNQEDFSYLVEKYSDPLLRYILRLTNIDKEGAEDILQEIFIKAYFNLRDYDDSLKFSSWIYRIAHNEVIDNYRRLKSRPKIVELDINVSQIQELSAGVDLLENIAKTEEIVEIKRAISKLKIKYQEVLVLKFIEDKDYKEIADIIKKPLGTVASRINKAKEDLKKIVTNKKNI